MTDIEKRKQLNQHKLLATGLFILMAIVFCVTSYFLKHAPQNWLGYVNAFAEAAMVGALADWFAVTALFHHPMGIPIPHTNLIENSKKRIGDNLGNFVVSNFLTSANLRPYVQNIKVSGYAAEWLQKGNNNQLLLTEGFNFAKKIISSLPDEEVVLFIEKKGRELIHSTDIASLASIAIKYLVQHQEHEQVVTALAQKIKEFLEQNQDVVKERVHKESPFFIPGFVDRKLADKISNGLIGYFEEIATTPNHRVREEISNELLRFAEDLTLNPLWSTKLSAMKDTFLQGDALKKYAGNLWQYAKEQLLHELSLENGVLQKYLSENLGGFAHQLETDEQLQNKVDGWIRLNGYRYILKNSSKAGELISNTVGNWKGRELSQKLELEVGKDLQFIRINGTIVGGLVGLLLHLVSQSLGW